MLTFWYYGVIESFGDWVWTVELASGSWTTLEEAVVVILNLAKGWDLFMDIG
jgi:hypothetical protein